MADKKGDKKIKGKETDEDDENEEKQNKNKKKKVSDDEEKEDDVDDEKKEITDEKKEDKKSEEAADKDSLPYTIRAIKSQVITKDQVSKELMCFICAKQYKENEHYKMLACCHFFHSECIGRWMRINAFCPQCKRLIEAIPPVGMPMKCDYHESCCYPLHVCQDQRNCKMEIPGTPKQTFIIINQKTGSQTGVSGCCDDDSY